MTKRPPKRAHASLPSSECAPGSGKTSDADAHLVPVLGVCASLRVSGTRDDRIRALGARQRQRVSRSQLLTAGISYEAIGSRVRRGHLTPLPGSVFAVGPWERSQLGDAAAALLAVGFNTVISGLSAAVMWGLLPPQAAPGVVHVLAPLGARRSLEGIVVHRTRSLAPDDIRILHGLPITSPARALLDVSERMTVRRFELAFDQALVARIMYRQDAARLVSRTRGRAAGPRLRALLDREHGTTVTRSEAEERFLALIRRARLPAPEVNARIAGYEVDFLWRAQRLVVEIDGYRYHSTRRAFEHDHRKDAALREAEMEVLRCSYDQLSSDTYAMVASVARRLPMHAD